MSRIIQNKLAYPSYVNELQISPNLILASESIPARSQIGLINISSLVNWRAHHLSSAMLQHVGVDPLTYTLKRDNAYVPVGIYIHSLGRQTSARYVRSFYFCFKHV